MTGRWWSGSCLAILAVSLGGPTATIGSTHPRPAAVQDEPSTGGDGASEDRRNPRRIRRDRGQRSGPVMTAGGMPLNSDPLEPYDRLEPLIGEWTFTGTSRRRPDREGVELSGQWSNAWALDGYYMRSEFTLDGNPNYRVIGFTCYDVSQQSYEAHFYNSNSAVRTFRRGNFDADHKTLTMDSHFSNRPDDTPTSKIVFEIRDDDHFTYSGWQRNRDGEWWRSFELAMTRKGTQSEDEPSDDADGTTGDSPDG